jgi:zinc transporter ZupT
MYQYSGPGSQQVNNDWNGTDDYWFMMLTQQGYIVACVDGRGTGFKGADFKKCTQKELGKYEVEDQIDAAKVIASLETGAAFGEMGLLSGGVRTATIRSTEGALLLEIGSDDFKKLMASDHNFEIAALHLSHERSIQNLSVSGINPDAWAKIAMHNLEHISKSESQKLLLETGSSKGAGLAIVLGNILDTIPGCLVIGAGFHGFGNMSVTLMLGMFLGGIPEAAVSASMLTKAGYNKKFIFGVWSLVLIVGMLAAVAGKQFIGNSDSLAAVFFEAVAGGAVLALVAHTMIPEAIHEGGSKAVLPTVAGFLLALFFAMNEVYG